MATSDPVTGPNERAVLEGLSALGDAEVVALLLSTGRKGERLHVLAAALLETHGGIEGLARTGTGLLSAHAGVGHAKAMRIAAAIELGRRASRPCAKTWRFHDSRAVAAWAAPHLIHLDHEELWLLALDGMNGLRAARRVAVGGRHGLHVAPCDPLRIALREGASGFILVHNHPSGDPRPSAQDLLFTERMEEAAELVATPLVDHVIVARDGHHSMLEAHGAPELPSVGAFRALPRTARDPP